MKLQEDSVKLLFFSKEKSFAQVKKWNLKKTYDGVKSPKAFYQTSAKNVLPHWRLWKVLRNEDNLIPQYCILRETNVNTVAYTEVLKH